MTSSASSPLVAPQARTQPELLAAGRQVRARVARSALADYATGDRDPVALLEKQNETRVQSLVPLRMGRMLQSPFAFYRGTAGIMAADLARGRTTDIEVVSCGDAHISNFGLYSSPQRSLVFDLNDFDEAAIAPFEWDVKRLVTSAIIGARDAGHDETGVRDAAMSAARGYRRTLTQLIRLTVLERYYMHVDTKRVRSGLLPASRKALDKATKQAGRRTSQSFAEKVTEVGLNGRLRIIENPPVLTHIDAEQEAMVEELFAAYLATVPADIALVLRQFRVTDVAMRVVGVGSVGTRCFVVLLSGPQSEYLVLQIKEAPSSVLRSWGGRGGQAPYETAQGASAHEHDGYRVVASQRVLQAVSDPFLGYFRAGSGRDFYVRQFRDGKASIEFEKFDAHAFADYSRQCANLLARAHAQSPNAPAVVGYLGSGSNADTAITEWCFAYAAQSLSDYRALQSAVDSGRIEATLG